MCDLAASLPKLKVVVNVDVNSQPCKFQSTLENKNRTTGPAANVGPGLM